MYAAEECVFFWTPEQPHGWASQWYPSPFTVTIRIGNEEKEVLFPTAEHWMMVQKALLFSDNEIAHQVLEITGTSKNDMAAVKSLGRKVSNFSEDIWLAERERIVLEGSLHKFRQNPELRAKLAGTGNKMLVEASPRDRIWGVGFGAKNAIAMQNRWGLNLLGKALVEARRVVNSDK